MQMNATEIFARLSDLLKNKFNCSVEDLTPGTTLNELGLDSLSLMEFIFAAEDAFSIRIPEEELDPRKITTSLGDISNTIEKLLSKN